MYTLGINAAFHDSAAALIKDGEVIAAAEDERFTRIKHGKRPIPFSTYELPYAAIDYCLKEAGITLKDVDHIGYSFDPHILLGDYSGKDTITLPLEPSAEPKDENWLSPWDPLFLSSIVNAPRQLASGYPLHLQQRLRGVSFDGPFKWHFVDHHLAHAASAFLPSPYTEAAVLVADGRGEQATTSYYIGKGNELERIGEVELPHSLGLLYERVTEYLGFLHSSDEYKVMAMASYGQPKYADYFRKLITLTGDGKYTIAPLTLEEEFGPQRLKSEPMTDKHNDIASSLQVVLEETMLKLVEWLHERTGLDNLVMAGGVALNCVMNARIRGAGIFENIWVQPAAGDAGTALGAAMWIDAHERNTQERAYVMNDAYLGPGFDENTIEKYLQWTKTPYRRLNDIAKDTADILAEDKIIGWYQGRMEYGPRALGARSILASPIHASMQAKLNEIKDREDFRPVAPAVMEEHANEWFKDAEFSPFMLFIYDVLPDKAAKIPAVRHVDGTARIQTVNHEQNPAYYDLLKAFYEKTGVPVLVNTSFNTRGEPVVCTPQHALESFWSTPLDALIIGPFLVEKSEKEKLA